MSPSSDEDGSIEAIEWGYGSCMVGRSPSSDEDGSIEASMAARSAWVNRPSPSSDEDGSIEALPGTFACLSLGLVSVLR